MKKNIVYLLCTFLLVGSVLGYFIYKRLKEESGTEKGGQGSNEIRSKAVVRVSTITASKQDLVIYINTVCLAKALKEVDLMAKTSGEVLNLNVSENSSVQAGQILFKIKNEAALLDLESAENDLLSAKIEYAIKRKQSGLNENRSSGLKNSSRLQQLEADLKAKKISAGEYQDQKIALESEELLNSGSQNREKMLKYQSGLSTKLISSKIAKLNYDNTFVKAPFSGTIANVQIAENEYISSGRNCFKLVDLSQIKLEIPILESEIGQINEGRRVKVSFNAYPEKSFEGVVKKISPVIDEKNRTCNVTVYVNNSQRIIKPGMTGNATIEGTIYKNRLIVPKEAVIVRDNRKLIFIAENGKAKWLYVKTGLENFDYVEILDQLKEGQQVVVTNNYTLAHDADIVIENSKKQD